MQLLRITIVVPQLPSKSLLLGIMGFSLLVTSAVCSSIHVGAVVHRNVHLL